jgi:tRNA-dihydrouridine synthase A
MLAATSRIACLLHWIVLMGIIVVGKSFRALPCTTPRHYLSRLCATSSFNNKQEDRTIFEGKQQELHDASTLSLAPMMEYTDRHFRHLVRLVSSRTLLYTEMIGASTLHHEQLESKQAYRTDNPDADSETVAAQYNDYLRRYLSQGQVAPLEGPSVLQLGGSDPELAYSAAKTVMEMSERGVCDYTAINLNCGCPSPKVAGKGCFGAALMDEPKLVADITKAISSGCHGQLPVTVKCRIGTDTEQAFTKKSYAEMDPEKEYSKLCNFIETVASDGIVQSFDVHARIAVLQNSFSPADNRKIPPLKYDVVSRLVKDFPELRFSVNGGIETIDQARTLLNDTPGLQGIMIGRAWAADPWRFAMADQILYNMPLVATNRLEVLKAYGRHADAEEEMMDPAKIRRFICKAVVSLFAGEPRSKQYRIRLDEIAAMPKKLLKEGKSVANQPPISEQIVNAALECLSEETLLRTPEESYERFLWQQQKPNGSTSATSLVTQWQAERKLEEARQEADGENCLNQEAV